MDNFLLDLDGTICEDIPNEESHRYADAVPFEDAAKELHKLLLGGNTITYFTAREEKDRETTIKWLEKHGFPKGHLIMGKPRGGNYFWIDNHKVTGIRFYGNKWDNKYMSYFRAAYGKNNMNKEEFTLFWHGPFSQWHPSIFEIDGVIYNCAEQWMMASKARMFEGRELYVTTQDGELSLDDNHRPLYTTLGKIMTTTDPRVQKHLGRDVKNFSADAWNKVAKDIV